jgi:hypothetical protein
MSESVWTATLTTAQLAPWLAPPRAAAPFAILERLTAIDFPAPDEAIDVNAWAKGSIFGEVYELRWERRDTVYQAWLIGEEAAPDFTIRLKALDETRTSEADCYLWGPNDPRIARPPQYRALGTGAGRPRLLRREFRRADGALAFYRLTGMAWEAQHESV